jgi:DNA sulfur modification protein DndB
LTPVTLNRDPQIIADREIPRPDAIALYRERGIVAECKSGESSSFQLEGLETVRRARDFLKPHVKKPYGTEHLVALLAVRSLSELDDSVRTRAGELRVALIDERRIEYYLKLQKETGLGMRHIFWGQVYPALCSPERIKVPALRIKIGQKNYAYLFSANAHDLLVRAFVSHRELHEDGKDGYDFKGYQRMLKKSRLGRIKKYIDSFHSFPTPIVVTFSESGGDHFDLAEEPGDPNDRVRIGTLHLPRKPVSIQIIDGQHRLFGYTKTEPSEEHVVHVIAYKEPLPSKSDPAEMFVEINSEQKPVPRGLLWELYPHIYKEDNSNYYKALISDSLQEVVIDGAGRGLVGHIGSGMKGPIAFATLCSEISKGSLLSKDGGLIAQIAANDNNKKENTSSRLDKHSF